MKISVAIVTRDSALHLAPVLECVKDFDEVMVVDMGSRDETLDIARKFGCKIIPFGGENGTTLEDARNYAIEHAKYEWVMMVEPNELFPPALRQRIREFVEHDEGDVLLIPRKNYLMYRFRKGSYPDYRPRLFRRRLVKWTPNSGNLPLIEGKMESIPASRKDLAIIHLSTRFRPYMGQHGRAESHGEKRDPDAKIHLLTLMVLPFMTFMKKYFNRGTFLYGKDGFLYACRCASTHFNELAEIHINHRIDRFNADHEAAGIEVPYHNDFK